MKEFILKGAIPGFLRCLCLAISWVISFNALITSNLETITWDTAKLLGLVILGIFNYNLYGQHLITDLSKTLGMIGVTVVSLGIFNFC